MQIIHKYFPDLTEKQIQQFTDLQELYEHWNAQINVISRKNMDSLYTNHILHSLAIAKVIQFEKGTKILDIGTGGGFPGIPLAILFPEVEFLLVDSIGKKIKVVNEVSTEIGLKNVRTMHERAENIKETFDFVVSRAVTNMTDFKKWVKGKFNKKHNNSLKNGVLYLKGGDLSEELRGISHTSHEISDTFKEEFFETKKVIYISY
ncbi:16S rRNA (guanine(527)-N(7))-methyltransferase RsmG [Flavobacteriales bacterium]|jgi:16S rRNA (guanine527-N7)-methyltransferase|nr:16S rRNA (guanine(527)-N(7))-methyltransferase RsmG [Flavobacteriales bacterium]MBT4881915.1 16S rRNA (guanine(527)-N(7))-methyltransferase RsmG [Flavobacteriales bacterium]MDC3305406.1 16S rRNA (guanine(527)-N(7))-methyltransferase RsmG [Flavobacteriales bacterium]MDC3394775.1 16S rRNA (guanine(527)-N(7))-methyltransferase RsmG [Flavobacteriales bacterium]